MAEVESDDQEADIAGALLHKGSRARDGSNRQKGAPVKRTVEMFDLMLKTGTKVKGFNRQEEERIKA